MPESTKATVTDDGDSLAVKSTDDESNNALSVDSDDI